MLTNYILARHHLYICFFVPRGAKKSRCRCRHVGDAVKWSLDLQDVKTLAVTLEGRSDRVPQLFAWHALSIVVTWP